MFCLFGCVRGSPWLSRAPAGQASRRQPAESTLGYSNNANMIHIIIVIMTLLLVVIIIQEYC